MQLVYMNMVYCAMEMSCLGDNYSWGSERLVVVGVLWKVTALKKKKMPLNLDTTAGFYLNIWPEILAVQADKCTVKRRVNREANSLKRQTFYFQPVWRACSASKLIELNKFMKLRI